MWVRMGRALVPLSFFLASVCLALLAAVSAFSAWPVPLALSVGCFFGLLCQQFSFASMDWVPADVARIRFRFLHEQHVAKLAEALRREERENHLYDTDIERFRRR